MKSFICPLSVWDLVLTQVNRQTCARQELNNKSISKIAQRLFPLFDDAKLRCCKIANVEPCRSLLKNKATSMDFTDKLTQ